MSKIYSINPATGKVLKEYRTLSNKELIAKIDTATEGFNTWKSSPFSDRKRLLLEVATILRRNKESYGRIITQEMGKRIAEAVGEVDKCAWVCEYYAKHAEGILKDQKIKTDAEHSYIIFQPLGIVMAIMPWNFPFWQVFRCAAPAIMAGNTVVLKHASNVPDSALLIEQIFHEAGAPQGVFQTLLISSSDTSMVIEDPRIRMINFTGSEEAGATVASLAGKNIKKTVLELGGSDPFIVLNDANIEKASEVAATSRMIVSGQSCIAAKRFIIQKDILPQFLQLFKKHLEDKKIGDPMDPETGVCPLSSERSVQIINDQVQRSIAKGAKLVTGGRPADREGFYYLPTILTDVTEQMAVTIEETFGPVAVVISVDDDNEALRIANNSRFGLGSSVWTSDPKRAQKFIQGLEAGGVFINSMVKSDPRMPFGGTKFSGYGRELSDYGLKEFVNVKSVWIEK